MAPSIKPAYKSQTIWIGVLTFVTSVSAIATKPDLYAKLGKCATTFDQAGIAKVLNDVVPILTALGGIGAVASRFKTGGIYTPKGIIGPNKDQLVEEENTLSDQVSLLRDLKTLVQNPTQAAIKVPSIVVGDLPNVDIQALAQELDK